MAAVLPCHSPVASPGVARPVVAAVQAHQDEGDEAPRDSHQPSHSDPGRRSTLGHEGRVTEALGDVDVAVHRQDDQAEVGQVAPKNPQAHAQLAVGHSLVPVKSHRKIRGSNTMHCKNIFCATHFT